MAYIKSDSSAQSCPNGESNAIVTDVRMSSEWEMNGRSKRVTAPNVRGPFRLFVLFSNESDKTKKKQCDSERKRMRRERADIERERMQAYREMPVTPPHQRKMCVRTHEAKRQRQKKVRYKEKSDNNNEVKKSR